MLEQVGHRLDREVERLFNLAEAEGLTGMGVTHYIEEHINIVKKAFTEGNNIPTSTLAQNICKEIKDKYGNYKTPAIILMHDCMTKTTTVEALSEIIKFLKNESYAFKALK